MELSEKERRERAEYRRLVDEEFERKRKTGFKNAEEALKAFRDLFESDEEMEEFMAAIRRDRHPPDGLERQGSSPVRHGHRPGNG